MPVRQPNDNVNLVKISKTKWESLSSKDTFACDQHVDESGTISGSRGNCHCLGRQTGSQGPDARGLICLDNDLPPPSPEEPE